MTYTAYVMDKADREIMTITRDYPSKKEFAQELRQNGFAVKFISTPEKFNHDLETYCEKKERRNRKNRFIRAELKKHKEESNEETAQEDEKMTASREFLNITTKKRYDAIQVDTDTSYYVKNATDETAATRYALEKFLIKLENIGTIEAETIADIIRMNLKNNEFMFSYNSISEGGNAWEIEINDYCDGTMSIYIRIAEYMCDASEEPAADQEPEEETTENYVAWCGMIENDVITDEFETLSEAVDEVETRYNKNEMKAAGITFCKLLCNSGQWLECLEEKQVDDVFYGPFKKLYDVFYTFSARGLDIYSHKPERWSRNKPPVIALETEEAIYYCDERDKNNVVRFLNRNSARANTK